MKVTTHLKSLLDESLKTNLSSVSAQENDRYERTFSRIVREDELINHRMVWLLTSQSILFGAYALQKPSPSQSIIVQLIPWVALSLCLLIYTSIIAAVLATYCFRKEFSKEFPHVHISGPPLTHLLGLVSPLLLPLVFIGVWVWILLI